jgi:predicted O-methyltransferase YrrM/predicted SAM-dependent methyltransferase
MKITVVDTIQELMRRFGLENEGVISVEDVDIEENDTDRNARRRRDAEVLTTIAANHSGRILEIGTSFGNGTFKLASNLKSPGRVTTVNVLPEQISGSANLVTHLIGREEIGSFWRAQGLSNVDQAYADTMSWNVPVELRDLDVVFIDGCHDERYVHSDSHLLYDRIRPGGFLIWHDFNPDLRRVFPWIHEVMSGIERFLRDRGLEPEVVHLRNSFMGVTRIPATTRVSVPTAPAAAAPERGVVRDMGLDERMRGLRYLVGFTAHDRERLDDEMARCARLREAGWDVRGFCLSVPGISYAMPNLDRSWRERDPRLLSMYERLAVALEGKDVFVLWTGAMIHPDMLAQMRSTFNVYVCSDDPESSDVLSKPVAPLFDCAFTRNLACVDDYRRWGCRKAHWLCPPVDPDLMWKGLTREMILEGTRSIDVVMFSERVLGLSDRAVRLEKLRSNFPKALLRGKGWDGGYVPRPEMLAAYRDAKIGWNLHNSIGPTNSRLSTLPAFGVMEICDNASQLAKVFQLDREIVGFETIEECIDKTRFYLAHDRERREIAAVGWERFTLDFSEAREWERIASKIQDEVLARIAKPGATPTLACSGFKLHVGCANDRWEGWTNIDRGPTPATDMLELGSRFAAGSCQAIHLMHVLNDLTLWEARDFLATARKLLAPGGELVIETVDAAKAARKILHHLGTDFTEYMEGIRGFPGFGNDHLQERREYIGSKMAWTPWHLGQELTQAGFGSWCEETPLTHAAWRDFRVVAKVAGGSAAEAMAAID